MGERRDQPTAVFVLALAMALVGVGVMLWLMCHGAHLLGELIVWFVRT